LDTVQQNGSEITLKEQEGPQVEPSLEDTFRKAEEIPVVPGID
jgi:hypothetical protein